MGARGVPLDTQIHTNVENFSKYKLSLKVNLHAYLLE